MENLILLLTASLVLYKSSKRARTLTIGDTGCSVTFYGDPVFDHTITEDGDSLYFTQHRDNHVTYGALCAKLVSPLDLDEAREVMTAFLNRLHSPFHTLYNTGISPCRTWNASEENIRLVDYWQDADSLDWKVKGYTDGSSLAILYVKNISDVSVEKQDAFLDSFCFPG